MYGIDQDIMNQIAKEPTEHSWMAKLMELDLQQSDEAEMRMIKWVMKEAKRLYPDKENVDRIVYSSLLFLMENKAIMSFLEKNPDLMGYLPDVETPDEAASLGAMEIMYVPQEDERAASEMMEKILSGEIQPNLSEILP